MAPSAHPPLVARDLPRFVRDMLSAPPPRGQGLNLWFFRAARVLHPFRSRNEIIEVLRAATHGEPLQSREIERAVDRSAAYQWKPGLASSSQGRSGRGWPALDSAARAKIVGSGFGLVDLWEASPIRFEDAEAHTEEVIDALFPGDPLICAGLSSRDFATLSRTEWRGHLSSQQFVVPSPMCARTGRTLEGRESAHTLENTGARRFLVIEQDQGSLDEQAALLLHLAERAPLALAVHSGGKSIHGWFYCVAQTDERLRDFMFYAVERGADRATWTRSQFVRMPDGRRATGELQTIYFFNPEVLP